MSGASYITKDKFTSSISHSGRSNILRSPFCFSLPTPSRNPLRFLIRLTTLFLFCSLAEHYVQCVYTCAHTHTHTLTLTHSLILVEFAIYSPSLSSSDLFTKFSLLDKMDYTVFSDKGQHQRSKHILVFKVSRSFFQSCSRLHYVCAFRPNIGCTCTSKHIQIDAYTYTYTYT